MESLCSDGVQSIVPASFAGTTRRLFNDISHVLCQGCFSYFSFLPFTAAAELVVQ